MSSLCFSSMTQAHGWPSVGFLLRGGWLLAIMLCAISLGQARFVRAEDPSGLQAAIAIEQAMIKAIAAAEKSVVSIARVDAKTVQNDNRPFQFQPQPILPGGVRQLPNVTDPRDPAFVPKEFATGIVVGKGLVLTNFHCVQKGDAHLITTINRKVFRCSSIFAADPRSDLAILKVDPEDESKIAEGDFIPMKFGDAKGLKKGQIVITLGNPYGIARDGQVSASWGIISNLSRKLSPKPVGEEPTLHQFGTLIQTDARLNWGTSGGALLNLQGEMIGLTTSLAATSEYEQAAGYAIPIDDTFRRVINTLKEGREVDYGFLGVMHEAILAGDLQPDRPGLYVKHVTPGGPAARAGLSGGEWITHIGGRAIHNFDDLRLAVGRYAAGDGAPVIYERRSERGNFSGTANIVLGKYHRAVDNKAREAIFTVRDPAWRGMTVDFASIVDRTNDGLPTRVVTAEVAEDSAAYQAGVRSGMFIASIGATPIDSPAEFRRTVQSLTGEVTVTFIEDSRFREFPRQQLIAIPAQPRAIDPPVKK